MKKISGKLSLINRLNIIEGHIRKIRSMVQNGEYCIDILHQTNAVEEALNKVDDLILDNHLNTCVSTAIKKGNKDKVIAEIMNVFKKRRK